MSSTAYLNSSSSCYSDGEFKLVIFYRNDADCDSTISDDGDDDDVYYNNSIELNDK